MVKSSKHLDTQQPLEFDQTLRALDLDPFVFQHSLALPKTGRRPKSYCMDPKNNLQLVEEPTARF